MKDILKNIAVFVFLTFAVSAFVACTKTSTSSGDNAVKSNSDFPPVPSGVMQASVKELDGGAFKLEDKRGKVMLVNLWAIWCGPCVQEMPAFEELQQKYQDKNFEVVGLNIGGEDSDEESADAIKSFAEKKKIDYHLAYSDAKLTNDFMKISKQGGIPQSFLIDREGRLRGVFFGTNANIISKIRESIEKVVVE